MPLSPTLIEDADPTDADAAWRAARDFFASPSAPGYEALRDRCARLGVWRSVNPWALHFLTTGRRLDLDSPNAPPWPLRPVTIEAPPDLTPVSAVLFEVALRSGAPMDALALTKRLPTPPHMLAAIAEALADADLLGAHGSDAPDPGLLFALDVPEATAEALARALTHTRPDASARVWEALAALRIGRGNARSYDAACDALLGALEPWAARGQRRAWVARVEALRARHARKRALVVRLDALLAHVLGAEERAQ